MKVRSKDIYLGFVSALFLVLGCGDDGGTTGSGGTAAGGSATGGNDTGGAGSPNGGGGSGGGGSASGGSGGSGGDGGAGGALRENGASCSGAFECESGACSDGVCCTSACVGTCVSCLAVDTGDADGECGPVTQGSDPGNECEAGACASGSCNGAGACELASVVTECRAASGLCDVAELCDGINIGCGADALASAGSVCGNYLCDGNTAACPTSCGQDLDCAPDNFCADGTCLLGKRVFATSTLQNGNLGGLSGADALCQNRASTAGLSGQFRAYMSDSTVSAATRLTHATIPYRLVTGTIVADNWQDLTDGSLDNNIIVTELGSAISNNLGVWTGTDQSGALSTMGTNNCQDWQSSTNANSGVSGFVNNVAWSAFGVGACNGTRRIYCFQQ